MPRRGPKRRLQRRKRFLPSPISPRNSETSVRRVIDPGAMAVKSIVTGGCVAAMATAWVRIAKWVLTEGCSVTARIIAITTRMSADTAAGTTTEVAKDQTAQTKVVPMGTTIMKTGRAIELRYV